MKKSLILMLLVFVVCACSHNEEQINVTPDNYISDADALRYRNNIVEKRRGPNFVSYEYRDVRIDELTPLAVNYCKWKNENFQAHLREIIMRENHSRLATFDCISLQ